MRSLRAIDAESVELGNMDESAGTGARSADGGVTAPLRACSNGYPTAIQLHQKPTR